MSVEAVKKYFSELEIGDRVLEFEQSSATVELAAIAVGCEPDRIAKSISLLLDGKPIIIVVSGESKIDNKKYKEHFHAKAKMIPFDEVEQYIGHAPGGVCPFAIKPDVTVYLDESLKKFETVYPAAGSSNSAIELNLEELEKYAASSGWVDVCKGCEIR
ncbi:MAG: YbaK/EbsC family protein [Lachnospiraceae bacterium]|nr:YbaK/EbsC family protein [Lachnospiraceae bacterium]